MCFYSLVEIQYMYFPPNVLSLLLPLTHWLQKRTNENVLYCIDHYGIEMKCGCTILCAAINKRLPEWKIHYMACKSITSLNSQFAIKKSTTACHELASFRLMRNQFVAVFSQMSTTRCIRALYPMVKKLLANVSQSKSSCLISWKLFESINTVKQYQHSCYDTFYWGISKKKNTSPPLFLLIIYGIGNCFHRNDSSAITVLFTLSLERFCSCKKFNCFFASLQIYYQYYYYYCYEIILS